MFELGPFIKCPACERPEAFGRLQIAEQECVRQCKLCRHRETVMLPKLNKMVVYIDQFAISNIFKVHKGISFENNYAYWKELTAQVYRAYLLQQVIFPASNVHMNETIVSKFPKELRLAHEMLSGDIQFIDTDAIEIKQSMDAFKCFIFNSPHELDLAVDNILDGQRNSWLPDLHITTNIDYSPFAGGLREDRARTNGSFSELINWWRTTKPSFATVFSNELSNGKRIALEQTARELNHCLESVDIEKAMGLMARLIMREFQIMKEILIRSGASEGNYYLKILEFWNSEFYQNLPTPRLSAYLFAALSRKILAGKKECKESFFNDVKAISSYSPFVDAIFVDRECAGLLAERQTEHQVNFRARVFSLRNGQEFIDFFKQLADRAPDNVKKFAAEFYGVH